ncbi:MAG: hypothetical protein IKS07_06230 [Lachnospiraceae bacterium]|nr:hypothetical protein [Lachnospiraceae bacterium]
MPVMDEFKEEREQIKSAPLKKKLEYFWEYYKWYVLGGIVAICVIVGLVRTAMNRRDTAFYCVFLNFTEVTEEAEQRADQFLEVLQMDPGKYRVYFDTSLYIRADGASEMSIVSNEKLMTLLYAQEMDYLIAGEEMFTKYAYQGILIPLGDYLTEDELSGYEGRIFYVDRALMTNDDEGLEGYSGKVPVYPDPFRPEEMRDPLPVALCLDDAQLLHTDYVCTDKDAHILGGAVAGAKHKEAVQVFLNYLEP